jgi:hypothetical protein
MINNSVTLTDSTYGSVQFAVKKVDVNAASVVTLTGDSLLAKLNVEKTAQPFSGNLRDALIYYCSLCGVTPTFTTWNGTFASISVNYIGWTGNVWDHIKMICSVTSLSTTDYNPVEAYFLSGSNYLAFRPALQSSINIDSVQTDMGQSIDSFDSALTVDVYNYNTSYVTDATIYTISNYDPEINPNKAFLASISESMSVGAGETLVKRFTIDTSLVSVRQPTCVSTIGVNPYGQYTIVGNDNLPIQPSQWVALGGSLTVALTENPNEIEITVVAPSDLSLPIASDTTKYSFAPYRIGVETSGNGYDYPAIFIVGTGVKYNKKLTTFLTGSDSAVTSKDAAKVIDNPFITNKFTLANAGLLSAQSSCSPSVTMSGSAIPSGFSFGDTIGKTFAKNNVKMRLSSIGYSADSISWSAQKFTTFADFDTLNTANTFSDFDTATGGTQPISFNEFSIIPLMTVPKTAVVNLVDNPSFTSASIAGWTGDSVSRITSAGYYRTAPAGLVVDNPDTDANANYTKTNALTIGQAYSLSFWVGGPNSQTNAVTFYAGTASKSVAATTSGSGWTYYKIENVVCAGNTTLSIQFNAPFLWTIDDISVVAGVTAV